MKWISRLYIFFLGIILSITTGFGVAALYPEPIMPNYAQVPYPAMPKSCYETPQSQASPDCQALQQKQNEEQQKNDIKRESEMRIYNEKNASYTRTAVFFGIVIGALFAIFGIVLIKKSKLIATGLLLGGVLTALLTRFLIGLASLGGSVGSTAGADILAYVEFGILLVLSGAVIGVGLYSLQDTES